MAAKKTPRASQGAVKKGIASTGKAVGAEIAGGGPENPAADIAALSSAAAGARKKASPSKKPAPKKTAPKRTRTARALGWAWSGSRKILLAEFILVIVIVWMGAITSTGRVQDDMPKAMIKSSALAGLFFLLALIVGSGQKGPAKAATALATLITVAYVFTSPESRSVVSWAGSYFAPKR